MPPTRALVRFEAFQVNQACFHIVQSILRSPRVACFEIHATDARQNLDAKRGMAHAHDLVGFDE
ncbi:MAG: hypothetical protein GVY15_05010 [Bacteroidetes bacterium]|nr:hypothetical protein [Bacteroidota bacterium]